MTEAKKRPNSTDAHPPEAIRSSDSVRADLIADFDTVDLIWSEFALLEPYSPIPAGTLCTIYNGGPIPKKWHKHLNMVRYPRSARRPTLEIHRTNAESAFKSITDNLEPEFINALTDKLVDYIMAEWEITVCGEEQNIQLSESR